MFALLVNVAVCFLLIPSLGVIGAALANLMATLAINMCRMVEVWLYMHMHAYDFNYIKPLIAGGLGAILAALVIRFLLAGANDWLGALTALGMLVVYLLAMLVLGLSEQDKAVLGLVRERLAQTPAA